MPKPEKPPRCPTRHGRVKDIGGVLWCRECGAIYIGAALGGWWQYPRRGKSK